MEWILSSASFWTLIYVSLVGLGRKETIVLFQLKKIFFAILFFILTLW